MEEGLYVYCIIPAPIRSGSNFEEEGIQIISHRDVAAVVEKTPIDEFQEETFKSRAEKDLKWLEEKVMHHNNVISRLAEKTTVIPMKFGTIFKTEKTLDNMLEEKYQNFLEVILNLDGKEEWGIKVYCDANKLKEELVRSNQHIKDIDAAIKDKSEGAAYFLKRKRESLISEEGEKKINECAASIHEELGSIANGSCLNKLQPKELTKKETEMILNGAYLILREKVDALRAKATDLQKIYADFGLELEISGPWPPYSFACLE